MDLFDPSSADFRQWGRAAVDMVADYLDSVRDRRVYPDTSSRQIREKLDRALPLDGTEFDELLGIFRDVIVELSRHNGHPRMFGYVQSPGSGVAAIADLLASALNANLTAWRSAPAAVEIERLTIDWIKEIIGLRNDSAGLLVSGGSMANLAALAVARRVKATADVAGKGAQCLHRAMRLYCSEETHHSIEKAASLLGIGRENVRKIEVDERRRVRLKDLETKIEEDLAAGHSPLCVVANVGTVMTGAVDSLTSIGEIAARFNLWMHVDAAYGGFAVMAESARNLFQGIESADSVALDPHKWLYLPVDCGCVLYRDAASALGTFSHDAEYTRVIGQQADEAFAFWDYGPELSRRFRALKVWMMLKGVGVRNLGEAIEGNLACARHFERRVQGSEEFEMLAPVELSIFCFRYLPPRIRNALTDADETGREAIEKELNAINEQLLLELQRDGSSYLSNAMIAGRFGLRGCVINYRTTPGDMDRLLEDLRRVAGKLDGRLK